MCDYRTALADKVNQQKKTAKQVAGSGFCVMQFLLVVDWLVIVFRSAGSLVGWLVGWLVRLFG